MCSEHSLRVFVNNVSGEIFEHKMNENGEWSRFHNEELHSLFHSTRKKPLKKIQDINGRITLN
jgi:hypothetical protein